MWFKRDDKYLIAGVCGGKARTCWHLAQNSKGLVTAGSRHSPQINIVAHVAKELNIPCRSHVPFGELSAELLAAKNIGAEVVQHNFGYNTVIVKRAKDDAKRLGWTYIPFGMECQEAVDATKRQVDNIPKNAERIVTAVGSGMSLAGILYGLKERNLNIPVLGIIVGADPTKRLNKYAPWYWEKTVRLWRPKESYGKKANVTLFKGIRFDSIYEAKALPYLREGDLFWVVGIRQTERLED